MMDVRKPVFSLEGFPIPDTPALPSLLCCERFRYSGSTWSQKLCGHFPWWPPYGAMDPPSAPSPWAQCFDIVKHNFGATDQVRPSKGTPKTVGFDEPIVPILIGCYYPLLFSQIHPKVRIGWHKRVETARHP